MKKKIITFTCLILVSFLIGGCDIIIEHFPPFNETLTPQSNNTFTLEASTPTNKPTSTNIPPSLTPTITLTPTFTDAPQDPTQDVLGTVVALQETLDAASAQIATLEAEKTSSSSNSSNSSSSSSSSNSNTATPEFPSNVKTVTIIHRANLRISKRTNDVGKPVMSMPSPRIVLEEGSIQYIYNKRVDADGDTVYYEIYDPDGVVTQVLYIRAVDIQVRTSIYNTIYGVIPEGVVYSHPIVKATLRYIKIYNDQGTPIMKIIEPRVVITSDFDTWIYPKPIYSDGGNYYYEIYDPDGIVTTVLYARVGDLYVPNALQQ